jgi:porin
MVQVSPEAAGNLTMSRKSSALVAALAGALLVAGARAAAAAEGEPPAGGPALTYALVYTADVTGLPGNGVHAGRYLDNLDAVADVDLQQSVGWRGATLHAYVLNNSGGAPNALAGTLQGVDNIEVAAPRLRLFELWLEKSFAEGKASVRGGLYNLNSEFYSNETAGLLIAPAFGIGSELAATGPNGPSIFPSTALGVRLNADLGGGAYARAAVLNAKAGVMGDPQGVDFSFGDGVLSIVQIGLDHPLKVSFGAWRYSRTQPDIRDVDATGAPVQQRAQGAYLTLEHRLFGGDEGRLGMAFLRLGISDGNTTPFRGGWQAGVRIAKPFVSRPDSAFSIGFEQGVLDRKFRANLYDQGVAPSSAESGVEVTYADRLSSRITVQPDLQWIHHPGGDSAAPDRWVAALRVRVDLLSGSAN